jgi:hypothetical protein
MRNIGFRLLALCVASAILVACTGARTGSSSGPASTESPAPAAEGLANGTVVDGVPVGLSTGCVGPDCDQSLALARNEAAKKHGVSPDALGPPSFYEPYLVPGSTSGGGGGLVVVFALQNGSLAAVETFCFDTCAVVNPSSVSPLPPSSVQDHGPLVDPFVGAPTTCSSAEHPLCDDAVAAAIATATSDGLIKDATKGDTHYWVSPVDPGSPEAGSGADFVVTIYVAGTHDVVAERAIPVSCGASHCTAMAPLPS